MKNFIKTVFLPRRRTKRTNRERLQTTIDNFRKRHTPKTKEDPVFEQAVVTAAQAVEFVNQMKPKDK